MANDIIFTGIGADPDTANVYVTVGNSAGIADGSTPSDPTSGANDGSSAYPVSGGTITTSINCPPGATAVCKIRGADSGGTLGPVLTAQFTNKGASAAPIIASFLAEKNPQGCPDPSQVRVTWDVVNPPSGGEADVYIIEDGVEDPTPVVPGTTSWSTTTYGWHDTDYALDVAAGPGGTTNPSFAFRIVVKDALGATVAAATSNTVTLEYSIPFGTC